MCGICGVGGEVDELLLRRMTATMVHRGPDDEGFWLGDRIGLGVRRLSIIDPRDGRQPMANEDGTSRVVFNGEIYNHQDLRRELEARGHRFRTRCDTEVLVHLHEQRGDEAAQELRGMFAYALWSASNRRLLLVRDRLGIKPLYYAQLADSLIFASEIKALLVHPGLRAALNADALDLYLAFQYVPGPDTMFRGIFKLPPAHYLSWQDGRSMVRPYAEPPTTPDSEGAPGRADVERGLLERLEDAVRSHMISDVPIGALLSGGLDSSSVVAMMTRAARAPVRTFTVGFDLPGAHNEILEARRVAQHLKTEHHELIVTPNVASQLPRLVWHLDEPLGDPAALPTYLLCQFARHSVPVVLTGEGADELLGGYPRYAWFGWSRLVRRWLPGWVRERAILPALSRSPLPARIRRAAANALADGDDATRHLRWVGTFDPATRRRILSPDLRGATGWGRPEQLVQAHLAGPTDSSHDVIGQLMRLDMTTWLVDDILLKMDKMSMAASVEARVPFLDHRLADWVVGLPVSLKIQGLRTKAMLKHVMRDMLPSRTLRRRKQAFQVPLDPWLRGPLRTFVADTLSTQGARERGWFNTREVDAMVAEHASGRRARGRELWQLVCLELWAAAFLDGGRARVPA